MNRRPMRIAIVRALHLGDLLVAVPALRAIRARFPRAEITLIGLPWAASFACRYQRYVDRFVEFVGYPGLAEVPVDAERTRNFIAQQQAYQYDLVIQMHGSGRASNNFVLALQGKMTAGYYEEGSSANLTYSAPYPQDKHEIFRNLGIAALLGCTALDPRLEFPLLEEDYAEAASLLRLLPQADRPWIGIHPGARPPARRWPAEYFARLADDLADRWGAQVILTGSPGEETTVRTVSEYMQIQPVNLVGKTSLGGLAALISKLDLFVSNDTGPAHLACAVDCPSITIFGPADERRWAPLDQERHPHLLHSVACRPCGYWQCPIDHRCLRGLLPGMVSVTAQHLLADAPQYVHEGEAENKGSDL